MNRVKHGLMAATTLVSLLIGGSLASDYERWAPDVVLIQNATVWTQTDRGRLEGFDMLVRDGKIARIGQGLDAPRGAEISRRCRPGTGIAVRNSESRCGSPLHDGSSRSVRPSRSLSIPSEH